MSNKSIIGILYIYSSFLLFSSLEQLIINSYINLVGAFIFYCVFQHIPQLKKNENSIEVLNKLVNSILEGFLNQNMFQHEKSISYVEIDFTYDKILDLIEKVKDYNFNILQIKSAIEVADSRFYNFKNTLILSSSISPNHALQWITLTDKVRLLSDELKRKPQNITLKDFSFPLKSMKVKKFNTMNENEQWLDSAQFRFIEFMEEYLKRELRKNVRKCGIRLYRIYYKPCGWCFS